MARHCILLLLYLLVFIFKPGASQETSRPQIIQFFNSQNCPKSAVPPQSMEFQSTINLANYQYNFQSFCVIRGAWRVEYNTVSSEQDYFIVHGDNCRSSCINKDGSNFNRKFGLVQRISAQDIVNAQFNLYEDTDFRGREVQVNGWEHTFNQTYSFSSVAFTSFSNWTWQVFYKPQYKGTSFCYRANPKTEVTLYNRVSISVGSVRLGCNSGITTTAGLSVVFIAFLAAIMYPYLKFC